MAYDPMNAGPLANDIAMTFRCGTYTGRMLEESTTLYRSIGPGSNPAGSFWTATRPSGPVQSIIDMGLNPQWRNTATRPKFLGPPERKPLIFQGVPEITALRVLGTT